MSSGRRVTDRRRRVLYSAHQAEQNPSTAASRNELRRLREARRPQEAYGSRVHRRLSASWFSLVPVRRRSITIFMAALLGLALGLCFAHYTAVSWPSIAYRPEVARPLRIDRPDSFGHFMIVAMLAASSGVSLLIYQLRRYRNDDYQGHYRLWRVVMIVMLLASVNAMVGVIGWSGALLDATFGKRVALTGGDWIRLVVSLGGAVLAIRLLAEVRRCRVSLTLLIGACLLLLIPEAAKWNVLTVESLGRWLAVTSAPLLACTLLFMSLSQYLRMLYREVRQIEDSEPLMVRLRQMRERWWTQSSDDDELSQDAEDSDAEDEESGGWFWRRKSKAKPESTEKETEKRTAKKKRSAPATTSVRREEPKPAPVRPRIAQTEIEEEPVEESPDEDAKPKRRWFGLRKAKATAEETPTDDESTTEESQEQTEERATPKRKKRKGFSLRLKPPSPASGQGDEDGEDENEVEEVEPKKSRRGWFRRKPKAESDATDDDSPQSEPASGDAAKESEPMINGEDIDWNSLSKAERRRLRKQLKRQNRAA